MFVYRDLPKGYVPTPTGCSLWASWCIAAFLSATAFLPGHCSSINWSDVIVGWLPGERWGNLLKWKTSEEDEIPSASNFCLRISNVIWWRLVKVKTCQNVHLWMFKVLLHKNLDLRKPGNQRLRSNFLMWYLDDSCLVELPRQVKSCTRCYLICFHDSKNFRFHTSKAVLAFQNLTSLPSKSNSASKVIIGRAMNFLIAAFGHVPFAVGHLVLKLWSFLVGWKCQSAVYLWRGTKKGQLPGAK